MSGDTGYVSPHAGKPSRAEAGAAQVSTPYRAVESCGRTGQCDHSPSGTEAFEIAWQRHAAEIHRRCRRWMGASDLADEAFSRAAVIAFQKFPRLHRTIEDPRKWLIALAHNVSIDLHREFRRDRLHSIEFLESWPAAVEADPERTLLTGEMGEFLRSAVQALPSNLRQPMELQLYGEKSVRDIAELLDLTPVNVRKRMQQARERLRAGVLAYHRGDRSVRVTLPPAAIESADVTVPRIDTSSPCYAHAERITGRDGTSRDLLLFLDHPPKRPTEAQLRALEEHVRRHPRGRVVRLRLARAFRACGRIDAAIAEYRALLARYPDAAATGELMALLQARGEDEAAREAGEDSLERAEPRHRAAVERLLHERPALDPLLEASRELDDGRITEAIDRLDNLRTEGPAEPLVLALLADAHAAAGHERAAARCSELALASDPASFLALRAQLRVRIDDGLVRGADGRSTRELMHRFQRLVPARAEVHELQARLHIADGDWETARAVVERFTAANPRYARGWLAQARVLALIGRSLPAVLAAWYAHQLDPHDLAVTMELARILPSAGRGAEAREVLAAARAACPCSWPLAMAESELVTTEESARTLIAMQPRLAATWLRAAEIQAALGNHEEAAHSLATAWRLLPPHDAHRLAVRIAMAAARLSDDRACWLQTALERAGATGPAAEALYARAAILEQLGRYREALETYRRALARSLTFPLRGNAVVAVARLRGLNGSPGRSASRSHRG